MAFGRSRKRKSETQVEPKGDADEGNAVEAGDFDPSELEAEPASPLDAVQKGGGDANAETSAHQRRDHNKPPAIRSEPFVEHRDGKELRGKVHLLDYGDKGGIGITVEYEDKTQRPPEHVRAILKAKSGAEGQYDGPRFRRDRHSSWHEGIGEDAPPKVKIAKRLNMEQRFRDTVDALTHAGRIEAEREQDTERSPA